MPPWSSSFGGGGLSHLLVRRVLPFLSVCATAQPSHAAAATTTSTQSGDGCARVAASGGAHNVRSTLANTHHRLTTSVRCCCCCIYLDAMKKTTTTTCFSSPTNSTLERTNSRGGEAKLEREGANYHLCCCCCCYFFGLSCVVGPGQVNMCLWWCSPLLMLLLVALCSAARFWGTHETRCALARQRTFSTSQHSPPQSS